MDLSLCTISFRHHLLSIEDLAVWARANQFQGLELWGIHALNLAQNPTYGRDWLAGYGLAVRMISDYLPLDGDQEEALAKVRRLGSLAQRWGAPRLRTFAGQQGSTQTSAALRQHWTRRLRRLCEEAAGMGLVLLVETHPNTLADTAASTLRLLEEVDHPALAINFDVLHVWEGGDDPAAALAELRPWIGHFHLKNVAARELLDVFAPANVYAAAGSRKGMVPLFEGAFDYRRFLPLILADRDNGASLEWFGGDVQTVLARDRAQIHQLSGRHARQSSRLAAL